MDENPRFKLVFAKLRLVLEQEGLKKASESKPEGSRASEPTPEELDEIDELRRIVLEVTEPESISFTTT